MQQAIIWANVHPDLYCHMGSLGHNELNYGYVSSLPHIDKNMSVILDDIGSEMACWHWDFKHLRELIMLFHNMAPKASHGNADWILSVKISIK